MYSPFLETGTFLALLLVSIYLYTHTHTGLEDTLRHKINVQIEDFRAAVQHTLGEQFNQYRFSAQSNTQPNKPPEADICQVGAH